MSMLVVPSRRARDARTHLLDPEILQLQGIAACAFLLSFGLLILALAAPAYWLPGQLARLLGLLWAVPAATVMAHRHARLNQRSPNMDVTEYLGRMRLARWAALGLALIALPCAQWHFQEHQSTWFDARLVWPMALSAALCWWSGSVAERLIRAWYLLHQEERGDLAPYDYAELSTYWGLLDRGAMISLLWAEWFLASLGLAITVVIRAAAPVHMWVIPFAWSVLALLAFLALGPLLIGRAVAARWRSQWAIDRVTTAPEVTSGWSQLAFTLTLLSLAISGPLVAVFLAAHRGLLWLLTHLRLPAVTLPSAPSSPPSSTGASSVPIGQDGAANAPALGSGGGSGWHLALPHVPSLVWFALALFVIWRAVMLVRRQEGHGVSRWLVLAALALELGSYLAWLIRLGRRSGMRVETGAPAPTQTVPASRRQPRRAPRLREMLPRQAILMVYGWALDLAARRGHARRPSQTPWEHARAAGATMPPGHQALRRLSDLFVAARYGNHPVSSVQAARMEALWRLFRRALRQSSRRHAASERDG